MGSMRDTLLVKASTDTHPIGISTDGRNSSMASSAEMSMMKSVKALLDIAVSTIGPSQEQ
jgi:hypothetical protein